MRHSSPLLAIDETLYPYHRHIGFKQYNLNKPAEYGLLYRSVCDSAVSYTCKSEKVGDPAAKYYFTVIKDYSKYLINKLTV